MLRHYNLARLRKRHIAPKGDIKGRMNTKLRRTMQWRYTWLGLATALAAGIRWNVAMYLWTVDRLTDRHVSIKNCEQKWQVTNDRRWVCFIFLSALLNDWPNCKNCGEWVVDWWVWNGGGLVLTGGTEVLGEKHYTAWVVDGWMSMEQWWNDTDRGNWSTGRKTLYSVGGRWMNEYGAMVE